MGKLFFTLIFFLLLPFLLFLKEEEEEEEEEEAYSFGKGAPLLCPKVFNVNASWDTFNQNHFNINSIAIKYIIYFCCLLLSLFKYCGHSFTAWYYFSTLHKILQKPFKWKLPSNSALALLLYCLIILNISVLYY